MKKISILLVVAILLLSIFIPVSLAATEAEVAESGYSNAIETTNENLNKKDKLIAEYSEKYGSETNGTIAYVLYIVQKASIPICFLGLVYGALNYFIIGNKKLEKKEQGFSMICSFLIGFVFFQVVPLIFAIAVAGR